MRVLVCGGRDFNDWNLLNDKLYWVLFEIGHGAKDTTIISGAARGADSLAIRFSHEYGTKLVSFPADWTAHGKAAGPIRNQQMIDDGKPDLVVAFPGGTGTADMVRRAKKHNIQVIEVQDER